MAELLTHRLCDRKRPNRFLETAYDFLGMSLEAPEPGLPSTEGVSG